MDASKVRYTIHSRLLFAHEYLRRDEPGEALRLLRTWDQGLDLSRLTEEMRAVIRELSIQAVACCRIGATQMALRKIERAVDRLGVGGAEPWSERQ